MSAGLKGAEIEISNYLRTSLSKRKKAFSLTEVLIVAFILSIVIAALVLTLNVGQFSNAATSAKLDLEARVRQLASWILTDVRQAVKWEIASDANQPSSTHIKFKQVQGWDSNVQSWIWSNNFIEYEYNPTLGKITRRLIDSNGNIIQAWEFDNITTAPFYTRYDDVIQEFQKSDLQTNGKLIVVIAAQKQVQGSMYIPFTIKAEAKIRNG